MNSLGRIFRISIFGESHGQTVGVVIDGCKSGILLSEQDFVTDLQRRKSGGIGTTSRIETDEPKIISGVFNNYTTGAPLTIIFENLNKRSEDYNFNQIPRPGHSDFTASKKYNNFNDFRGGGHFSGRLTLALVAAGVVAKKMISEIEIDAKIVEVGGSENIEYQINEAIKNNDSVGGIIKCVAKNIPIGLGEPFFDSLESVLAHAIFSIPAIKGIEFGAGFESAKMFGSEHNDVFIDKNGKTKTNNSGGINGGISNGNDLIFRVAVKPTSSISLNQSTFNFIENKIDILSIKGRHDVCIALRMPVIIEAVTAIVLADFMLIYKTLNSNTETHL